MSSEPLFALCPAVLPGNKPSSASVGTIPAVFKTGMAFVEVFSLKQQLQNIHFAERVNTFGIKSCIFFHNTKKYSPVLSPHPESPLRGSSNAGILLPDAVSARQTGRPAPLPRFVCTRRHDGPLCLPERHPSKQMWRRHPEECRRHVCQLKKSLSEFFRFPVLHVLGVHLPD